MQPGAEKDEWSSRQVDTAGTSLFQMTSHSFVRGIPEMLVEQGSGGAVGVLTRDRVPEPDCHGCAKLKIVENAFSLALGPGRRGSKQVHRLNKAR